MDLSQKISLSQNTKSNFYYSFLFLPKEKREAINVIYSFCDISDNIVDAEDIFENKKKLLFEWRNELKKSQSLKSSVKIINDTNIVLNKYEIPIEYLFILLEGMEMDLNNTNYNSFDELYKYCYNVASIVGLISSKIFGYTNKIMEDYAINLGIALQLTNIIRDIKEDAKMGRIYFPNEELNSFGVDKTDIITGKYSDNFFRLINFQFDRAVSYYKRSDRQLLDEEKKNFIAARIMRNIYFEILLKIKQKNFSVFDKKITISKPEKIIIAIKTLME